MDIGSHINTTNVRRLVHAAESLLLALIVCVSLATLTTDNVRAASLGPRRITITDSAPSANTTHEFRFDIETVHSVGSIEFQYCSNSPLSGTPCTAPAGLNVSGASILSQLGESGFSIHPNTTANRIVISRAAANTTIGTKTFTFDPITNPSTPNQATFVRISTFPSTDGTGAFTDNGGVAFVVTANLTVNAYVPPFLILCVGVTVAGDCSTVNGTNIDLGVLASSITSAASSQFGVATNDPLGYQTYAVGTTMTAGNNVIPALTVQSPSSVGASQFGINVRANTVPSIGQNPTGVGSGILSNLYDDPNLYRFQSGDMLANATLPSDFNIYTISYIVNVDSSQAPGRYSTTMTIVGIAAF